MFRQGGHPWGLHRVLEPKGALPQAATRLDTTLPPFDNEIRVRVSALHLDSASFLQLKSNTSPDEINRQIENIIQTRGKMHNPVTNSGGVFLGRIGLMGPLHPLKEQFHEGDLVTSLVSLTLTPLKLESSPQADLKTGKITLTGTAIVFASGMLAKMPDDISEGVALAAFDICGAPAQAKRHVRSGDKVLVLGLGKAGRTIALQAALNSAMVYGVDTNPESVLWAQKNLKGHFEVLNAQSPMEIVQWVEKTTKGSSVDVTFHVTNVDDSEMSAVLATREGGKVIFFGMNTSFQRAVLGAEGVGRDVLLLMGSGFVPGHAELMLNLLRKHPALRKWFEEKYG